MEELISRNLVDLEHINQPNKIGELYFVKYKVEVAHNNKKLYIALYSEIDTDYNRLVAMYDEKIRNINEELHYNLTYNIQIILPEIYDVTKATESRIKYIHRELLSLYTKYINTLDYIIEYKIERINSLTYEQVRSLHVTMNNLYSNFLKINYKVTHFYIFAFMTRSDDYLFRYLNIENYNIFEGNNINIKI